MSNFYDGFHLGSKVQTKIIKKNDLTYRFIIAAVDKYLSETAKILDIGCGAGTIDYYYASKGYSVFGIDISSVVIKTCRKTADALQLKNVKFRRLNFPKYCPSSEYDFIICSEVLEHIDNDKKAIIALYNLLKKDGFCLITVPLREAPLAKVGLLKKFDYEVGHLRRYNPDDLRRLLKENGFKIIEEKKIEGIIRNFIFTNSYAGKLIRFFKLFMPDIITVIDNFMVLILGGSNLLLIIKKDESYISK
ncbi:MAG: class I SAM-dependent methyltransferase [Actinobacteria bacterium]|nr:class I SAM-dependent methyltransferase [Actinomycetota bacterium]